MIATGNAPGTAAELERQYRAGHEGTVLVDRSALGRVALRGRDALDLVHRMSTNAVKDLAVWEGVATVFTTAKGRILDLTTLYNLGDRLLGITGEGRATELTSWLERYIFREKVTVEDQTGTHATLGLFGPGAAALTRGLFGAEPAERPLHQPSGVAIGTLEAVLARTFPVGGGGFLLTTEAAALQTVRDGLLEVSRGKLVAAGAECYEVLRIESGLPAAGRELTPDYNPWEARLGDAISLSKGCYIGQEVIARLNTYDKVSKQLVRLRLEDGPVPAAGTSLQVEGRPIGVVTSGCRIPGTRRAVALGYVGDEHAVAGREVLAGIEGAPAPAVIEGVAR